MRDENSAQYCEDCGRIEDVGCTCGMSFAEKIRTQSLHWASWSATR